MCHRALLAWRADGRHPAAPRFSSVFNLFVFHIACDCARLSPAAQLAFYTRNLCTKFILFITSEGPRSRNVTLLVPPIVMLQEFKFRPASPNYITSSKSRLKFVDAFSENGLQLIAIGVTGTSCICERLAGGAKVLINLADYAWRIAIAAFVDLPRKALL